MNQVGTRSGMDVQGLGSNGASGPSCQGGNQNAAVVLLGACALLWVVLLEELAWVLVGPGA